MGTMTAIRVSRTGGPDVLASANVEAQEPQPGNARVRVRYAGVNFIDVYHRTGLYEVERPFTPGMEGAGEVEAVGEGVDDLAPGDRVAWAMSRGSYAERAVVPAWKLVRVPDDVSLKTAAAVMLQGMTAHYLARSTFELEAGHAALVHAAAGGVGLLLVQVARRMGARVIGTVSTEEKARLARDAGASETVLYTRESFLERARAFTGGEGVHVVYDSVGKDTFDDSLASLRPRGMLALFGQSSGPVPPVDPARLAGGGSLYLTRPSLGHYTADREELVERATDLFGWIMAGELKVRIDRVLPLAQAAEAHRLLQGRKTAGKVLLEC